jgi:hypothetical protein
MSEESEIIKARLEALETALTVVVRRDPGVHKAVQTALTKQYQEAVAQAAAHDEGGFQRTVRSDLRPPRNPQAEQARVDAYCDLLAKVQGTV